MKTDVITSYSIHYTKLYDWLVGLNVANKMLFVELVSIGGVKSTTVEPMNVFRMSILKGAVKA